MRKILFSACCNTYTQQKACEGLIRLLKDGRYQVDMAGSVVRERWSLYDLAFAFNKRGYERIQTLHPAIPIIYSILADDYEEEFIGGATLYEHLLLIAPQKLIFAVTVLQTCFFLSLKRRMLILNIRIPNPLFWLELVMDVRH